MNFDPLISVKLNHASREYQPGDLLECEYQIDAIDRDALKSVEVATMWYTSGKGDEEEAFHYYERQTTRNTNGEVDLRELSHFSTELMAALTNVSPGSESRIDTSTTLPSISTVNTTSTHPDTPRR